MNKSLLSTILMALTIILPTKSWAQEPYAVLSDNNTVLTFYYDDQKAARNGMSVGPFEVSREEERPWYSNVGNITTVVFDNSFANCTTITSTHAWFDECVNLTTIKGIENLKTDNVTDMSSMFNNCTSLKTLDLSGFNTEKVTDMSDMFCLCVNLTNLDIHNFNTAKVTSMIAMFACCEKLTNLDLSGFNTENVEYMKLMFNGCLSLSSLDISNFNTSKVWDMEGMFASTGMEILNLGKMDVSNVEIMRYMFAECPKLKSLDLSGFNTEKVTNMEHLFDGCSSLTSLDVSNLNTTSVTNMNYMFNGCSSLRSLDVSKLNTENVIEMISLFSGCSNLTSVNLNGFKTDKVKTMTNMFSFCSGLASLDLSGFRTDNVTSMSGMFRGCSSLTTIYAGEGWSIATVTDGDNTFADCTNLIGGVGTYYNRDHVDYTYAHIDFASNNPGYFTDKNSPVKVVPYAVLSDNNTVLTFYYDENKEQRNGMGVGPFYSSWDDNRQTSVSNSEWDKHRESITKVVFDVSFSNCTTITSTAYWFYDFNNLTSITGLNYLNTTYVTYLGSMFSSCYGLTSLDLSNFNTANVTDMSGMFMYCSALKTIITSEAWSTAKVTGGNYMFYGCTNLIGGAGTRYDESHIDYTYAHIDGGENNPGYFTGVDNSLVAYYPFNGNANDESGHGNHGTPMENAALTVGVHGDANGAYQFGGTDNPGSIHVPNSESLQIGNEWSFATYVKPFTSAGMDGWGTASDYGWHAVLGHDHDQHGFSIQYEVSEDMFRTWIGHYGGGWNEGVEATVNGKPMNKWIHIAFTFANNVFRVYINGKMLTAFTTTPDFAEANTKDWYFGKYNDEWYPMNGILDEIRIYNRALRDDEVEDLAKYADKLEESGASFDGLTAWVSGDVPLEEAFMEVEGGREAAAQTIAAIVWENSYALTANMLQGISNPNLLVYVNEASLAPQGVQNVVVNGQAQEIVLTDAATGNNNWYCPQAFTAEKISYTRNFSQQTEVGVSRGWESIALPFTVQEITHESKGQITPFGANGTKHFWLRGYSPDGLYSAATLEANKPYVISMPNNTVVYPDAYNLNGRVTFSASNTTVPATPPLEEMMVVRDNIIMMPTFQYIPQNEYVYAVNVGQARDRYAEGSVFARDLRDVRPFEAYTTHGERNGARPNFIRIAAQPSNESVGIRDIKTDSAESAWYSIDGRKLQGEPQRKGVYIQKGKKIRVK